MRSLNRLFSFLLVLAPLTIAYSGTDFLPDWARGLGRGAGLVPIAAPTPGPVQPLYLVYHHELRNSASVRATVAAIEDWVNREEGIL